MVQKRSIEAEPDVSKRVKMSQRIVDSQEKNSEGVDLEEESDGSESVYESAGEEREEVEEPGEPEEPGEEVSTVEPSMAPETVPEAEAVPEFAFESTPQSPDSSESEESDSETGEREMAGIIENISLTNFMCHDFFELDLGPRLNFIIGRNGSGKSAIITGIAVGLGARATETNRGTSTQDLIKDGKSVAKIKITFKNKGTDCYKPEVYGDKIVIERKITRKSGASYSIRGETGKTISNTKSEVDNILLKYNIRVDNPLAFLSQDKAREFLTSTGDEEKFTYFMEGILMTNISDNYQRATQHLQDVADELDGAATHTKIAKTKFEKATETYDKFRHSDQLRLKLSQLNGKIFWFNVSQIEASIAKRTREIKTFEGNIIDIENNIVSKTAAKDQLLEERLTFEGEINQLREKLFEMKVHVEPLKSRRDKLKQENEAKFQEVKINKAKVKEDEEEIDRLKAELKAQEEKLNGSSNKDAKEEKLKSMKDELNMLKDSREKALNEFDGFRDIQDTPEYSRKVQEFETKTSDIHDLKDKLVKLKNSRSDKFSAWHPSVKRLITEIDLRTDWIAKPIGPLGSFISVKPEFDKWKDLINAALQRTLNAFLVTNESDRGKLATLMSKHKIQANIVSRKPETFDFIGGTPQGVTTFVDVLEFSDQTVLYTLVDINSIEKSIVATNSGDVNRLVTLGNVQDVYSLAGKYSGRRTRGNSHNIANDPVAYKTKEALKFAASTVNVNMQINETEMSIRTESSALKALDGEIKEMKSKHRERRHFLDKEIKTLKQQIQEATDEVARFEYDLENGGADTINAISLIKSQIQDLENGNVLSGNILLSLFEDLKSSRQQFRILAREVEEAEDDIGEAQEDIQSKQKQLQDMKDVIIGTDTEVTNLQRDKIRQVKSIEHCNLKIGSLTEKLNDNQTRAEEVCQRYEVELLETDTAQSIQAEFFATQKAVEEADSEIGITYEQAQLDYQTAQTKFEIADAKLAELRKAYKELSTDISARLKYLKNTLETNIKDASNSFEQSLDFRRFRGKLKVDVRTKKVTMLVAPPEASKSRTVESLSGGEKSFTQVAFLLSIWQIMRSKIRGLDEFDVFMDSVNRTMSIKLLLNELKKSHDSQTIFITPQDITSVANLGQLSPNECSIHRMSSPRDD